MELCGTPDEETLKMITNEHAKKYVSELPFKKKVPLNTIIKYSDPQALDLLSKMLELNPKRRITPLEALAHPYLAEFHDPNDEPTFTGSIDFSFEK